ncbi:MAG: hypothetical protein JRD89_10445 [Deltaproteobacteria bacterium]|nr:hypothetical protein [Deltaproteobacteria bacterium]
MELGKYSDGRPVTYDENATAFSIGGVPVTMDHMRGYAQAGHIFWVSEQARAWFESSFPAPQSYQAGSPSTVLRGSAAMACPHCQAQGTVNTRRVKQKKGVSGGKATAAVLTGGVSILATGLSRKEKATRAHCTNCGNTWYF